MVVMARRACAVWADRLLLVAILAALPSGSCRPPGETGSHEARRVNPADVLRRVAAGADSLFVVTEPLAGEKGRSLLEVSGADEIAHLLSLIDTPTSDEGQYIHHLCVGHPKIRLALHGRVVAEFSFDHVSLLRPYSKGLWSESDVQLTNTSARAMAAWFAHHGLRIYQQEFEGGDNEQARWDAFRAEFPLSTRAFLPKKTSSIRAFRPESGNGQTEDCSPQSLEPLSSEIPDQVERAHVIFRALGRLGTDWNSYTEEEATVLRWAGCLDPDHLVAAIDDVGNDPGELRGAARVLFRPRPGGERFLMRQPRATAERLALRIASAAFAEGDSYISRRLPLKLARFESAAANRVLFDGAARAVEGEDRPCVGTSEANASLSALVVLAARRRANASAIKAAASREWQCPANRAAARVAAALVGGQMPTREDLQGSDRTTGLMTLERLKRNPNRKAQELARSTLLVHPWSEVRDETKRWLASLAAR